MEKLVIKATNTLTIRISEITRLEKLQTEAYDRVRGGGFSGDFLTKKLKTIQDKLKELENERIDCIDELDILKNPGNPLHFERMATFRKQIEDEKIKMENVFNHKKEIYQSKLEQTQAKNKELREKNLEKEQEIQKRREAFRGRGRGNGRGGRGGGGRGGSMGDRGGRGGAGGRGNGRGGNGRGDRGGSSGGPLPTHSSSNM